MDLENLKRMSDNVDKAIDNMGRKQVCGQDLETADASFLEITDENINEAVCMQPTAISYFTACIAAAKRNLERINFEYELWRKEKHVAIKAAATSKITAVEMEVKIDVENKIELLEWRKKLEEAQQFFDNSESMYEGWKQKGFALNQHAKLRSQDYLSTSSGSLNGAFPNNDFKSNVQSVREIMNKNRNKSEES